jgi:hypothetical protein
MQIIAGGRVRTRKRPNVTPGTHAEKNPTLKGSHLNVAVRPLQGRILSNAFPGAALTYVRSAPGYCLYPLRGFRH